MSRQTASVFQEASRWNSFTWAHRHSHGHSSLPIRIAAPPKPTNFSSQSLFDALDYARFDQVRRAVAHNPEVLKATSPPRTAIATTTSPPAFRLSVVDYALNNCRTWMALIEHCERTGIAIPHLGDLTFRQRLAAMNVIIAWLLSHPAVVLPTRIPLHTAVACRFDTVCEKLLELQPLLLNSTDGRGKTPLHVCCTVPSRLPPTHAVRFIRMLAGAGAHVNAADSEGRTPLHDLVTNLDVGLPAFGLIRRRRQMRTLASVLPTVNELLIYGASIYVQDARGDSAMDLALATGVDYVVFTLQANWVYENICQTPYARLSALRGTERRVSGVWGWLPDEVVIRILRLLSPRDVVGGVGATCHGLRRIAVAQDLWKEYTTEFSMEFIRQSVWKRGLSPLSNAHER